MKYNQLALLFIVSFLLKFSGCDKILDTEKKPEAIERKSTLKIFVKDESGYMQKLTGNSSVPGADVYLKSNLLGSEYHLTTDSTGVAAIDGIISDTYLVSVSRILSPEEMQIIAEISTGNHKLTNTTQGTIKLRADMTEAVEVPVNVVIGGSPVVISEIYACGPKGSGLYFHDKYIELYNQTDSTVYLDGILVAIVYASSYSGLNFIDDPEFVHTTSVWKIPGTAHVFL
jgi:hypothetical protein